MDPQQRKINSQFDDIPGIHHQFNYKISIPYIKNKKILDVGCWTGQFIKLALNDTKKVTGIEPSSDAVKYAKKNLKQATFLQGSALSLPFPNKTFDTITLLEVIEHVPTDTEIIALKEINRTLKKSGYLILSTPTNNPISVILDPAYFLLGHRHYGEKQLRRLLKKSGFTVKEIYYTAGLMRLLVSNVELLSKHLLKNKIKIPKIFYKLIEKEYENGGFAQIHIIAQKVKD